MVSRSLERLSPEHVTLKCEIRKKRVTQTQTFVRLSRICNCPLIYTSYKASEEGQSDRSLFISSFFLSASVVKGGLAHSPLVARFFVAEFCAVKLTLGNMSLECFLRKTTTHTHTPTHSKKHERIPPTQTHRHAHRKCCHNMMPLDQATAISAHCLIT